MNELAPPSLALKGDPIGLQVGYPGDEVKGIFVTLDVDESAVKEAKESAANLIISHHPLIFSPLSSLNFQSPGGALIKELICSGINVFSAHTNLDIAPGGVNSVLAELFGLENTEILEVESYDPLIKLVVYVPEGYEDALLGAISEAGAGWIGNYSHCTFQTAGTGTFLPREGSVPFIGSSGKLEKVAELRIETILPESIKEKVLDAMLASHPYEEAAYDLYPLENKGVPRGLGLIGALKVPVTLEELVKQCGKILNTAAVRGWGDKKKKICKVAVCGGSGGSLIKAALAKRADVFISGDLKYHDIVFARAEGVPLIDAGHYATEYPVLPRLAAYLKDKLAEEGHRVEVKAASPAEVEKNLILP